MLFSLFSGYKKKVFLCYVHTLQLLSYMLTFGYRGQKYVSLCHERQCVVWVIVAAPYDTDREVARETYQALPSLHHGPVCRSISNIRHLCLSLDIILMLSHHIKANCGGVHACSLSIGGG